jgi:hypothetical protein
VLPPGNKNNREVFIMEQLSEAREIERVTAELEAAQQQIERLTEEIIEKADTMDQVVLELEKANTVLTHWFDEYEFTEAPDPRAALSYGAKTGDRSDHAKQSAKWFFEYRQITTFIDIINDYVSGSIKILEA